MKNYFTVIILLALCICGYSKPAETNTVQEPQLARAQTNLRATIERIDRLINALYEKEKVTFLNDSEYLRLERLQEARILAEMRLQLGTDDDGRIEKLLADAGEGQREEPIRRPTNQQEQLIEEKLLGDPYLPMDDLGSEGLAAMLREQGMASPGLAGLEPVSTETDSSQSTLSNVEKLLQLSPEVLEHDREITLEAEERIAEIDKKIDQLQNKLNTLIDAEYPDYADLYECSRQQMDAVYDKALEQIELRRSLRLLLTQSQMRTWQRYARESQEKTKSPTTVPATVLENTHPTSLDDKQIVYVPMQLQKVQMSDGSIIYQAVPLPAPNSPQREP